MNEDYELGTPVAQDSANPPAEPEPLEEEAPRRSRSRRAPVEAKGFSEAEDAYEAEDYGAESVGSRVREVLESSNAWEAMMGDENIAKYVRWDEEGVYAVPETPAPVRALLYNAATAILHANDVRYDAQHERPFYAREAED